MAFSHHPFYFQKKREWGRFINFWKSSDSSELFWTPPAYLELKSTHICECQKFLGSPSPPDNLLSGGIISSFCLTIFKGVTFGHFQRYTFFNRQLDFSSEGSLELLTKFWKTSLKVA